MPLSDLRLPFNSTLQIREGWLLVELVRPLNPTTGEQQQDANLQALMVSKYALGAVIGAGAYRKDGETKRDPLIGRLVVADFGADLQDGAVRFQFAGPDKEDMILMPRTRVTATCDVSTATWPKGKVPDAIRRLQIAAPAPQPETSETTDVKTGDGKTDGSETTDGKTDGGKNTGASEGAGGSTKGTKAPAKRRGSARGRGSSSKKAGGESEQAPPAASPGDVAQDKARADAEAAAKDAMEAVGARESEGKEGASS